MARKDWKKVSTVNIARWNGIGKNSGKSIIVGEMLFRGKTSFLVTLDTPSTTRVIRSTKSKLTALKSARNYMRRN